MKLGILFAGQGSQNVGMGKDLYESNPVFRKHFDILEEDLRNIAFEGPKESLMATENTQPIMLAFAFSMYQLLENEVLEPLNIKPACAAGLSLGEYSALTAAGVLSEKDALEIIKYRGSEMAKASSGLKTEMSAILGLSQDEVLKAVEEGSRFGTVEACNFNCPGQIVISGSAEGVSKAEEAAKALGAKRTMRLAVSGPFHTSYMKPVSKALEEKFKAYSFSDMNFPVYFNYTGSTISEGESVQELLTKQVSSAVKFQQIIENMVKDGVTHIIEIGPGKALSGFVKKTTKEISVISLEKAEDIEKVKEWIENQL